jgi:hypothetical protein
MSSSAKSSDNARVLESFMMDTSMVLDDSISDPLKRRGIILSLKSVYVENCAGLSCKNFKWNTIESAISDISKNGVPDPIEVESVITPTGKKYRVTWGIYFLAIAVEAGLKFVSAKEIVLDK